MNVDTKYLAIAIIAVIVACALEVVVIHAGA
jgi:hypothetical protein